MLWMLTPNHRLNKKKLQGSWLYLSGHAWWWHSSWRIAPSVKSSSSSVLRLLRCSTWLPKSVALVRIHAGIWNNFELQTSQIQDHVFSLYHIIYCWQLCVWQSCVILCRGAPRHGWGSVWKSENAVPGLCSATTSTTADWQTPGGSSNL